MVIRIINQQCRSFSSMLGFWLKVDSQVEHIHRRITDAKLIASVIVTNQVFLAGELQLQIRFVLIEILKEFFSKKPIM